MKVKGLIFDLDGTLLDTLHDLAHAANKTLEYFGFPTHPKDAYRYFVGNGLRILAQRVLPESARESEDVEKYMGKLSEIYRTNWNANSTPYPGIPEMIQSLSDNGLKLAVLSNKPHVFTILCVDTFFPGHPFTLVFGKREGVARKPDPAGALEIAEKMGLSVDEILYVGDTKTDMLTGNNAGMKTIGVDWGFRDRKELADNKAWKIVSTPQEVLSYAV